MKWSDSGWYALVLVAGLSLASASPFTTTAAPQDDDEKEFRLLEGKRAFEENCLICHSIELTESQRMTPPQWTAEVEKMMGWGSPVPPEQKEILIEYLASTYSPTRPRTQPNQLPPAAKLADESALAAASKIALAPEPPATGRALYDQHCATCHGPEALGGDLGNRLVLSPALIDGAAFEQIVAQGRHRMPGFQAVLTNDQVEQLLAWLRTRR